MIDKDNYIHFKEKKMTKYSLSKILMEAREDKSSYLNSQNKLLCEKELEEIFRKKKS